MFRIIALLLCALSSAADYVVDWRVPQDNDANANAWTLLEGAPVDGLEEELGKVAVVESSALIHLRDDPVDRAGLVRLRLRRGDKRRRGDVVAAARRVLKRFAADEHTYVEVTDAASPKSVITQSRAVSTFSGPFTGISCRPCKN